MVFLFFNNSARVIRDLEALSDQQLNSVFAKIATYPNSRTLTVSLEELLLQRVLTDRFDELLADSGLGARLARNPLAESLAESQLVDRLTNLLLADSEMCEILAHSLSESRLAYELADSDLAHLLVHERIADSLADSRAVHLVTDSSDLLADRHLFECLPKSPFETTGFDKLLADSDLAELFVGTHLTELLGSPAEAAARFTIWNKWAGGVFAAELVEITAFSLLVELPGHGLNDIEA